MAALLRYYDDAFNGRVFIGSSAAAGTAFPISTGTAATFGLWNTQPGMNAVLLGLNLGFTSGTIALGTIGLSNINAGYAIGTAAPLSAFTDGTPKNAILGAGRASTMRFTPSGATLTAGGTAAWWSGYGIESATAGLGVVGGVQIPIDGQIIVPPGQFVFVAGSIAQTGLFSMSLIWAEIPQSG